jgi:uncharacterized phage protein (TIGR02220 family)
MYGKIFSSLFTGSMYGAGSSKFALMGYVIANMKPDKTVGFQVELNVKDLASRIGETQEVIQEAIDFLCAPDPESRSEAEEGRRLVKLGAFDYKVVNGVKYDQIRNEEERREKNRIRQEKFRKKQSEPEEQPEPDTHSPGSRVLLHTLNELSGRKFREVSSSLEMIDARLSEPDVTLDGCRQMVARQVRLWKDDPKMAEFMRPETLFNKTKFNSYYAAREMPIIPSNGTPRVAKFQP